MKKYLFLIAILIVACIFAISISAKEAYLEEIPADLKNGSNDTATYFIVFDGPEYFVYEGSTVQTLNTEKLAAEMTRLGISTDNVGSGKTYLYKYVIPQYMIDGSGNAVLVTKVNFNNGSSFKTNATYFRHKVGYISISGTVSTVTDINECTNELRCFDFGENSQVTKIPTCFLNCATKMKKILNFPRNLPGGIESQAFCNCYDAFSGEIYINASSIGGKAFDNALANVTGIIFGPLTRSFGKESLSADERYVGDIQIEYIEFQCDITQLTINPSTDTGYQGAFYFGQNSGSQREPLKKLKCIILSNPAQANVADGTSFQSFFTYDVFFNANATNPVYTSHAIDEAQTTITYEKLSESGVKSAPCARCIYNTKVETAPIYTSKGYSVSDAGTGIDGGFVVNKSAFEEWQQYGGTENVKFGIVIFNPKFLNDGGIFDSNGKINTSKGALQVEFLNLEYESFSFMVSNFTEAHATLELVIAGYTVIDGDYSKADFSQKSYALTETPAVSNVTRGNSVLYTITMATVKKNQSISSLPEYVVPGTSEEE